MYQAGDYVVYGNTGTCKIKEIAKKRLPYSKKENEYYVLEPLLDNSVIFAPVENSKVFMRPVIAKKDAHDLIDSIPDIHPSVFHSSKMRELTDYYETALNSHNCKILIELTMSTYKKKRVAEDENGKFGAIDQKYMNKAEDLLFSELACALCIPKEEVQDYIKDKIHIS